MVIYCILFFWVWYCSRSYSNLFHVGPLRIPVNFKRSAVRFFYNFVIFHEVYLISHEQEKIQKYRTIFSNQSCKCLSWILKIVATGPTMYGHSAVFSSALQLVLPLAGFDTEYEELNCRFKLAIFDLNAWCFPTASQNAMEFSTNGLARQTCYGLLWLANN